MASSQARTSGAQPASLGRFVCFANGLRQYYGLLKENELPLGILRQLVERCNATEHGIQELTGDGHFLSHFFIRNCDSWQAHAVGGHQRTKSRGHSRPSVVNVPRVRSNWREAIAAHEPRLIELSENELSQQVPRWLWDGTQYFGYDIKAVDVKPLPGNEDAFASFPIFGQGQRVLRGKMPRWRSNSGDLGRLTEALAFQPGTLWIEPEVWIQPQGRRTDFHYDYDPQNLVFQVKGSRRFHILRPESRALKYKSWDWPPKKPSDYGTRWATQVNDTEEYVAELRPRDILALPNGWPHRVTYTESSIGFAVRSFTQCQALSLWLGQRLCVLSVLEGAPRICFDDEHFREHGTYSTLERA